VEVFVGGYRWKRRRIQNTNNTHHHGAKENVARIGWLVGISPS